MNDEVSSSILLNGSLGKSINGYQTAHLSGFAVPSFVREHRDNSTVEVYDGAMIRGAFIGVDKHSDPGIRDLSGAVRDATAIHALFQDSIPGLSSVFLCNERATASDVKAALTTVLGAAAADDIVIVTFSGHGTRDHRLVMHDTDRKNLVGTTIGMDEIAASFKACKAKAVLCLIDCCFSGGAPARVLEDTPASKDPFPFEALAGRGRIIIAASNVNEVAYESPNTRHGLLTYAFLEALQKGEKTCDVIGAMAQVMERVRTDAARLGIVQTPVMFGHVEGGLVLPVLKPGDLYRKSFPESAGKKVGVDIQELGQFGLPDVVLTEWKNRYPAGLNPLQLAAVNDFQILDGKSLLVIAPTSSGKTFVGEIAAAKAISEGRKAVFLLPYRALVNEKFDTFSSLYGDALKMRVVRCTGDHTDHVSALMRGKYDLGLLTYEMFLNLLVSAPAVLNQIGLVVIDEAQFITDPRRGITVELLLTFLLAARERDVNPQLIALSAVIGGSNGLEDWLGCKKLVTDKRPVPLVEGVLDRTGRFRYIDENGQEKVESILPSYEIQVRRDAPSAQDVIVPLVRNLVCKNDEKVIVFRNQRGTAQGCAKYLADELGLRSADDDLVLLPEMDLSSTSNDLRYCLSRGTAFHNTNLSRDEKQVVERAFRDPKGPVRVLGTTTTVAAGINTPASTVIIAEQQFLGDDGREFTVAEYKNMAGRAGRVGFNEKGKAIILANNAHEGAALFAKYVKGVPETVSSSFQLSEINTWIIRLLAQVKKVPRKNVGRLLVDTFGGFLASRTFPGWREQTEEKVEETLSHLIRLGLVEEEGDDVRLSLLGRACGQSSLPLTSAMRLVELLRVAGPKLSAKQFMALVQALPESDGGYTPLMKKGQKEGIRPQQAAEKAGYEVVNLLQRFCEDNFDYWARCKRVAILSDWISGVPVNEIEALYTANPYQGKIGYGDIRKFADNTRFHLRSAYQIAAVLFAEYGALGEAIDVLIKQLEQGLPAEVLSLLDLPILLERGDYLALYANGAKNVQGVFEMQKDELAKTVGKIKADRLNSKRS